MTDLVIDTTSTQHEALSEWPQDESARVRPQAPAVTTKHVRIPDDSAEYVDGLPLRLVELYADVATRHSIVREVDSGAWVATVVGLDGAWGDGSSPEDAKVELREAIIGWVAVKRRVGARDIPPMEGIDLNPRP